jgi:hypothetical protein
MTFLDHLPTCNREVEEAVDTLNSDVPAILLYSPTNRPVLSARMEQVQIDPYSRISGLRDWRIGGS